MVFAFGPCDDGSSVQKQFMARTARSTWLRNGDACKAGGVKFRIYCSPWDDRSVTNYYDSKPCTPKYYHDRSKSECWPSTVRFTKCVFDGNKAELCPTAELSAWGSNSTQRGDQTRSGCVEPLPKRPWVGKRTRVFPPYELERYPPPTTEPPASDFVSCGVRYDMVATGFGTAATAGFPDVC